MPDHSTKHLSFTYLESVHLYRVKLNNLDVLCFSVYCTKQLNPFGFILQDAFRSSFELSVIPAFEQSCKKIFEQVDGSFQKGMSEHSAAIQQHVLTAHTPLAQTLRVSLPDLLL